MRAAEAATPVRRPDNIASRRSAGSIKRVTRISTGRTSRRRNLRLGGCNGGLRLRLQSALRPPLLLDHVPDLRRHIRSAQSRNRANARWRRHVDLGEMAVDDVDADEQQSALAQAWAETLTDFALARREVGGLGGAAADHVGAQIVRRRHPVDRAGEFAVDQDDALVAVLDL